MTKADFLLTRPDHDITTKYLFSWSEPVLKFARDKNINLFELAKEAVDKSNFVNGINQNNPSFVFINGHGNSNTVTGYNNEPLVRFADNEDILKNKIAYALSCSSAKRLGPSCVQSGAKAYLGYKEDFIFLLQEGNENSPLQDPTAKYYMEPSSQPAFSILNQESCSDAYQKTRQMFSDNIQKFSSSEATAEDRELLPYLVWDRDNFVCLGDGEAKILIKSEEKNWFQKLFDNVIGFFKGLFGGNQ